MTSWGIKKISLQPQQIMRPFKFKKVHARMRILVSQKLFIDKKNYISYPIRFEVQTQVRKILRPMSQ